MSNERRGSDTRSVGNLPTELRYDAVGAVPPPTLIVRDREAWFVPAGQKLYCHPRGGHKIPESAIVTCNAGVRCMAMIQEDSEARSGLTNRMSRKTDPSRQWIRRECGILLWVLWLPGGLRFVAQVTHDELHYMQRLGMDVGQVLTYLGATSPMRAA